MTRLLDLDNLTASALDEVDLADLERITAALDRRRLQRRSDPELRLLLLRRIDEALDRGRIDEAAAERIRADLDRISAAVVLDAHLEDLVDLRRPALGAFRRSSPGRAPDLDEWLRSDPRRLVDIVVGTARFTADLPRVVEAVFDMAVNAGIDRLTADRLICGALRSVTKEAGR